MATINPIVTDNYITNAKAKLLDAIGSNGTSSDSMVNVLSSIMGSEINNYVNQMNSVIKSLDIDTASGSELDTIAFKLYRLQRRQSTIASATKSQNCIRFYVDGNDATFGSINNSQNIVIPKGTLISISNIFDNTGLAVYKTDAEYTLAANANVYSVGVVAMSSGSNYNIQNGLSYHNFPNTNLKVQQVFPILNGRDTESDAEFRIRIMDYISSQRTRSLDSLKYSLLNIPGILETRVIPGYYGLGTVGVIVVGQEQSANSNLINSANNLLSTMNQLGTEIKAFEPVSLKISLKIQYKKKDAAVDINNIKNTLSTELDTYLSFIKPGSVLTKTNLNSFLITLFRKYTNLFQSISNPVIDITITKTRDVFTEIISLNETTRDLYTLANDEVFYFDNSLIQLVEVL